MKKRITPLVVTDQIITIIGVDSPCGVPFYPLDAVHFLRLCTPDK